MGLKLFPPAPRERTGTSPSRKPSTRRQVTSPETIVAERSGSPNFDRSTNMDGRQSALDGRQSATGERQPQNGQGRETPSTQQADYGSTITAPPPAHFALEHPPRSHTSFSEAPTLVRNGSNSSRTSGPNHSTPPREEPVMRSIFPRYNPEIALEHQAYFPTQASPTHIPRTIINRQQYSPSIAGTERSPLQSPGIINAVSPGRFPRGLQDETVMEPSTTAELKELWKVVNGWKVSNSEGRRFCLKMTSDVEEPIHTLSSDTQPFYNLRLMPTSTSAQMTLQRFDPNKVIKTTAAKLASSKTKEGAEVMSTTLEEAARRLPPNDGLVALLYPKAASDLVIELANSPRLDSDQVILSAERECGRLVWDEDSQKYYLVHPSLSTPFIVSIHSSPAYSRVSYTLEHPELPRNLVRLVRDGTGMGWLEVDTAVAAKIDAFYVVDVAVCAILLVAVAEEKTRCVERFDAPPPIPSPSPRLSPSRLSSATWTKTKSKSKKKGKKEDIKFEEFEMDLESQTSLKGMSKERSKEEKVPGLCGMIWMMVKCFVWTITTTVKLLAKIIIFLSRCLTRSKK